MIAEPLTTDRLRLEPLTVAHAAAMVDVLAADSLYEFTGGAAPTLDELGTRYARQSVGRSADGAETWLNWVVGLGRTGPLVGYVQATVVGTEASIAWVVAPAHQGLGLATEAASAVADWLVSAGATRLVALIHPDHTASAAVAGRLGLQRTAEVEDGEVRWVRDFYPAQ